MAAPIRPVRGKAGAFVIAGTNKVIKLVEWREDAVYDTVNIQSGTTSTASGTELEFFDSLSNKKRRDLFNTTRPHNLPAGWELIVTKLGIYVHSVTGNTELTPADQKKVYENASLTAQINETLIADGWCMNYQVGLGLYGQTNETGQGVISPGVPSVGAAPTLLVPQEINYDHDLRAKIRFDAFSWATTSFSQPSLSAGGTCKYLMRGFLKRALTKG